VPQSLEHSGPWASMLPEPGGHAPATPVAHQLPRGSRSSTQRIGVEIIESSAGR
jgi:hypothetical protein